MDTVIVNFGVQLEDIVDYEYDQILAADRNGLNCGVWMIRNTEWSLWFLDENVVPIATRRAPAPVAMLFHFEQRAFIICTRRTYGGKSWRRTVRKANTVRARTKLSTRACLILNWRFTRMEIS